jgi:hypothetical protein
VNAPLTVVPSDRLPHFAVAEFSESLAFGRVVLAAVLGQLVDDIGVAADQRSQRSAGADRTELVVVAHEHELGARGLHPGGQSDQVGVLGHPRLIENHNRLVVESDSVVIQPPQQTRQRPRLTDLRLLAQGAGRLPGRGRTDHLAAPRLIRHRHHPKHRRLPRAGDTDDDLSAPPRSTHPRRGVTLFVRQLSAHAVFRLGDGLPHGRTSNGRGVGALELTADGVGNGVLGSQHRR